MILFEDCPSSAWVLIWYKGSNLGLSHMLSLLRYCPGLIIIFFKSYNTRKKWESHTDVCMRSEFKDFRVSSGVIGMISWNIKNFRVGKLGDTNCTLGRFI